MKLQNKIDGGRQVGMELIHREHGKTYWVLLAVQLYNGEYVAHVSSIDEEHAAGENFTIYKIVAHGTLDEAVEFLKHQSPAPFAFENFGPFKGQKAFYPEVEEIARSNLLGPNID